MVFQHHLGDVTKTGALQAFGAKGLYDTHPGEGFFQSGGDPFHQLLALAAETTHASTKSIDQIPGPRQAHHGDHRQLRIPVDQHAEQKEDRKAFPQQVGDHRRGCLLEHVGVIGNAGDQTAGSILDVEGGIEGQKFAIHLHLELAHHFLAHILHQISLDKVGDAAHQKNADDDQRHGIEHLGILGDKDPIQQRLDHKGDGPAGGGHDDQAEQRRQQIPAIGPDQGAKAAQELPIVQVAFLRMGFRLAHGLSWAGRCAFKSTEEERIPQRRIVNDARDDSRSSG